MAILAVLMSDSGDEVAPDRLNRGLPAGYTYLLQLVAHDCVQSPTPFWALPGAQAQARNGRIARLRLDTLYGGGPAACPFAYAPDDPRDTARTRLRLGPMRGKAGVGRADGAQRDIARAAVPFPAGSTPKPVKASSELKAEPPFGDPLIADPRNEDNALLAQMTALFHLLHNTIAETIGMPKVTGGVSTEAPADTERRFACARAATTMIYRHILRQDLLPRLLHPEVEKVYREGGAAALLDRDEAGSGAWRPDVATYERGRVSIPLEFSHGAARFAHAMVRPHYATGDGFPRQPFREALLKTSARQPAMMPLSAGWILRWANFFPIGTPALPAPALNFSRRIMPLYSGELRMETLFQPAVPGAPAGLAFQDLISAVVSGIWSVAPLIVAVRERIKRRGWKVDPFDTSPLTAEAAREAAIILWLRECGGAAVPAEDLAQIARDPPLPFYVQFEAMHDLGGERLGVLGSILMAEVLYGAMLDDRLPGERRDGTLRDGLARLATEMQLPGRFDGVPEIGDMAAMIEFIADRNGLREACPNFL
ncbi:MULTISPECIES: peroxidase family protein [Roseomonadaceae]|uniref:Animal haem peroxidase n=1 Tax=Falsiroseomonas oleicola TaxID=2801474 RepID=A0ABS6HDY6_9PROT|nr:peroxidase family protein [Roseomonas oleicola]MBU8545696.1 hypothetical protein [Roseomonas oleicola]